MKRGYKYPAAVLILGAVVLFLLRPVGLESPSRDVAAAGRAARIRPDYSGAVIPANIAPLNFVVEERGSGYYVRIHCGGDSVIEAGGDSAEIAISEGAWRRLLDSNRGGKVYFDVFVKGESGRWERFERIANDIAREDIDGYLVYRRIHPVHEAWGKMGVYCRGLGGFKESLVLDNGYFGDGCVNCHSFCGNSADKMLLGIRSSQYGSSAILVRDGSVEKIGTKFGYTAWHPSGRLAAYSINKVVQFPHSGRGEIRDVMDLDSLLAYYLVDSQTAKTSAGLSDKGRLETYPAWSADGRYLYFCSAALRWEDQSVIPADYEQVKYDLMRISYDIDGDEWGAPEEVISAEATGKSVLLGRVSPDGRRLLCCMCDYGCFPVYQESSDLYMVDLDTGGDGGGYSYRRLSINSDKSESWHSWSSNGRWIAFSSKRDGGVFTRIYLSYVDAGGVAHKAILLPQKDPRYYDSCLWTFSVPELVTGPVVVTRERLGEAVRGGQGIPAAMPVTAATPKAGSGGEEPWRGGHQ